MKRLLIIALIATVVFVVVRTRLPKLHERMEAQCKAMFEQKSGTQPGCCAEPSGEAPDADRTESVAVA